MKRWIVALALVAWTPCVQAADPPKTTTSTPAKPAAESAKPATAKPAPAVVDSLGMLEKAVAKDSTKFDNLYKLGVMYLDRDRVSEASRVFHKAHQLKPKDARVMTNLGAAYDAAGDGATAQKWYAQALAAAPSDSVALCRMAASIHGQQKYDEAMKMLRDMLAQNRGAHCAYFTLGVAFADAGIYRDAIRMWKKVVELAPNSPEASSAKESIEVLEPFVQN